MRAVACLVEPGFVPFTAEIKVMFVIVVTTDCDQRRLRAPRAFL